MLLKSQQSQRKLNGNKKRKKLNLEKNLKI